MCHYCGLRIRHLGLGITLFYWFTQPTQLCRPPTCLSIPKFRTFLRHFGQTVDLWLGWMVDTISIPETITGKQAGGS